MARTLVDLANIVDELTQPHTVVTPLHEWTSSRNRRLRRVYATTVPGLLQQLADAFTEPDHGEPGAGRSIPDSRPPGRLDNLSTHTEITIAAARWCWDLRLNQRDTVEGNIHALLGHLPSLDREQADALEADIRRWHHSAAIATGWRTASYKPQVPCPSCERTGTLRINLTRQIARCVNADCRAQWNPVTIVTLAEYIRTYTGEAA